MSVIKSSYLSKGDLSIDLACSEDANFMFHLRNSKEIWENLENIEPLNMDGQSEWIKSIQSSKNKYFIIRSSGERVGIVRLNNIDMINRCACIGVDVHPSYQRKGIAKGTYHIMMEYCFNSLNLNRLYLYVLDENVKAISLYEGLNFKKEGVLREAIYRNGKYMNYYLYGILRNEFK